MSLPPVSFTIEQKPIDVQAWQATAVVGGFDGFTGALDARVARRFPTTIAQGARLTAYQQNGRPLWEGRISQPPQLAQGLAKITASGPKVALEKAHGRLLYLSRDVQGFQDSGDPPMIFTRVDEVEAEVRPASLYFKLHKGEAFNAGDVHRLAFAAPGSPGGITSIAGTITKSRNATAFSLATSRFSWPSGVQTALTSHSLAAGAPTTFNQSISSPEDGVTIGVLCTANVAGAGATSVFRVVNLRVRGIATDDSMETSDILADIGGRVGYDTSGVQSSGLNGLPFDVTDNWMEAAMYQAELTDWWLRVVEDRGQGPVLEAGPWEKEWDVQLAFGAVAELVPLELYNRVVLSYSTAADAPAEVTVDADPDPLAAFGITNVIEEELADVQADSNTATATAGLLAARYSQPRYAGRLQVADARHSQTGTPYDVRPGDLARVGDWGPAEAKTIRITSTSFSQTSVAFGCEDAPVSITASWAREIAKRNRRKLIKRAIRRRRAA